MNNYDTILFASHDEVTLLLFRYVIKLVNYSLYMADK